jgi:hypothetical protein
MSQVGHFQSDTVSPMAPTITEMTLTYHFSRAFLSVSEYVNSEKKVKKINARSVQGLFAE